NDVPTNSLNHNTGQLRQQIPAASHLSMQGHDAGEQTVDDTTALLTGNNSSAKLPNPFCSNSDQALQSQAIPTAQQLGAMCLIQSEFVPQTIYPTPVTRASLNIAELIQPRIGSHDLTGDCIHAASVPDIDPPEYTEEDQSGQSSSTLGIAETPRAKPGLSFVMSEFDMQAFLAADVVTQEGQEEDCDEYQDALASEQHPLPETQQCIRILSEFVNSLYETAMNGRGPLRLDKLLDIQKSVGEELWEEMTDEV
ncbi:MAG: hypothetical protein Q9180_006531, partial [Flavoplaca navasiana]